MSADATNEGERILNDAKREFCRDFAALRDQDCDTCEVGRGVTGESDPCPLRMREVSAVQWFLNKLAGDTSDNHANVMAEYQNDPPPPETKTLVMLNAETVIEARSNLLQHVIPDDCEVIVQGRDVGRNWIHTVTMAISPGKVCRVIDYYATPVESPGGRVMRGTFDGDQKQHQIEQAVYMALTSLARADARPIYRRNDGSIAKVDLTCYDSRYAMQVVRQHCDQSGPAHAAAMGMGSAASNKNNWHLPRDVERARRGGGSSKDRTYLCYDGNCYMRWAQGSWRFYANADWYKAHVHGGYLIPPGEPGSISLFDPIGPNGEVIEGAMRSKAHAAYAQHVTAEIEEQVAPGVTRWSKVKGRDANHYLDATYLCLVAAAVLEWFIAPAIRLPSSSPASPEEPKEQKADQAPASARSAQPVPQQSERRSRRGVTPQPRRAFRRSY